MEEIKSLTYRVKEAVASTIEKAANNPEGKWSASSARAAKRGTW